MADPSSKRPSRKLPAVRAILRHCTKRLRETPLGRLKWLKRLQSELLAILHPGDLVEASGFRIRVHSPREAIAKRLITYGVYEEEIVALMRSVIRPGDTVADIGANIGCHTLQMSRLVGPNGKVLAFEPDPENLKLLRENVDTNGCGNVEIFAFALGDHDHTAKLYCGSENKGAQSLVNLNDAERAISVDVRKASDLLNPLPHFVKIDVEGAEASVIRGMDRKPVNILFEFNPDFLRAFGDEPLALLQELSGMGYRLSHVSRHGISEGDPKAILAMAGRSGVISNVMARR